MIVLKGSLNSITKDAQVKSTQDWIIYECIVELRLHLSTSGQVNGDIEGFQGLTKCGSRKKRKHEIPTDIKQIQKIFLSVWCHGCTAQCTAHSIINFNIPKLKYLWLKGQTSRSGRCFFPSIHHVFDIFFAWPLFVPVVNSLQSAVSTTMFRNHKPIIIFLFGFLLVDDYFSRNQPTSPGVLWGKNNQTLYFRGTMAVEAPTLLIGR